MSRAPPVVTGSSTSPSEQRPGMLGDSSDEATKIRNPPSKVLHRSRKQSRNSVSAKPTSLSSLLAASALKKTANSRARDTQNDILNYIKCIMYTFGDVQEPQDSAAIAISDALFTQMKLAYRIAEATRKVRDSADPQIQVVDVVSAFRHNFPLLYRVYKRLLNRSEARRAARDITQTDIGDKVIRELRDAFDQFHKDDLEKVAAPDYVDLVYQSRLVKMDERTQIMDQKEYLYFHKARSTSFVSTAVAKKVFMKSMSKNRLTNLSPSAVEFLSTIAYETLARMTEIATGIRGTQERPAPRFCKPKFRNPILTEVNGNLQELIPQSQLKKYHQYGLDPDDVYNAVQRLTEEATPLMTHQIKDMKDVRLF